MQKRRIVTYERVSTEDQLSALDNQHQWLDNLLKIHKDEWQLIKKYHDEAVTGTNIKNRDGFKDMMSDLLNHRVKADLIVTREFSRFARDGAGGINYVRMLQNEKIEVFFVDQNLYSFDPTAQMTLYVFAGIAEEESRRTSIRVKHGQEIARQKGVVFGNGNILGYDLIKTDKKTPGQWIINQEQAETVKAIYEMYTEQNLSMREISFRLEEQGRLNSSNEPIWSQTVVSQILKNPRYAGYVAYNQTMTTDFLSHNRIKNPEEQWQIKETDLFEPIIKKETWIRAQEIRRQRSQKYYQGEQNKNKGRKKPKHMYSRLLVCGECGNHFNRRQWSNHGTEKRYGYICNRQAHYGSVETRKNRGLPEGKCNTMEIVEWKLDLIMREVFLRLKSFEEGQIEQEVMHLLEKHIKTPDIENEIRKQNQLEKQLQKKEEKAKKLIDLYTNDKITEKHYEELYPKLVEEIEELKQKILSFHPDMKQKAVELKKNRLREMESSLHNLKWNGRDNVPKHMVETFIREIRVYQDRLEICLAIEPDKTVKIPIKGKTKKAFEYTIENEHDFVGLFSTADMALEQGKDVYALPGRATDRLSDGCNELLKQGAMIATSAADIIESFFTITKEENAGKETHFALPQQEREILDALDVTPRAVADVEEILRSRGRSVPPQELMCRLVELSLKGLIEQEGAFFALPVPRG